MSPTIVRLALLAFVPLVFVTGCDDAPPVDPAVVQQATDGLRASGARFGEKNGIIGKVDFAGKKVSKDDFANLGKLPDLQELVLAGATFDNADLAGLVGSRQLVRLTLKGSAIDDAGLEHLGKLTTLQQLDLEQTKVTDAGLQHLTGLTKLEKLYLTGSKATQGGAGKLKESLPKLSTYGP